MTRGKIGKMLVMLGALSGVLGLYGCTKLVGAAVSSAASGAQAAAYGGNAYGAAEAGGQFAKAAMDAHAEDEAEKQSQAVRSTTQSQSPGKSIREQEEALDRDNQCRDLENLEQRMTVEEFIARCDNGLANSDGCRLNLEKACVNGVEINLAGGGIM